MNTVFEGVTLDILPNGAAFITSGLTGKPLYSRCLSNFKERHEQSAFVQSIRNRKWFTREIENQINNFFERMNNRF